MTINLLVADDDDRFREMLVDILTKNRYCVLDAKNGKEALDIFYKNSSDIDLVILDVMMPEINGWEAAKEIRQHSEVPIMMLTALGDESSEIKGLTSGADDYLAKPFSYGVFWRGF